VPLFAHFGFVIFVQRCLLGFKFLNSMSIGTFLSKFTSACLEPVLAEFCLVVNAEVLDIPDHFSARTELHLLLGFLSLLHHLSLTVSFQVVSFSNNFLEVSFLLQL
jgi:hypothetical protein